MASDEIQETLADIVSEFREMVHQSVDGIIAVKANAIADRIEAAWRRERGAAWNEGYDHAKRDFRPIADELERLRNTPVGNAAAKREDASIERLVRDAIIDYQEMFANAPNDETEHELIDRANRGNAWLVSHGFTPENTIWSKEESPCL